MKRSFLRNSRSRLYRRRFRGIRKMRYTPKHARGKVLARKMLRRNRPERKWITLAYSGVSGVGTAYTQAVTPVTIEQGVGEQRRVGNQVSFYNINSRLFIQDNSSTATSGAAVPNQQVRIVYWSPRVDYQRSADYMNAIGIMNNIDFNVVTVIKDFVMPIGVRYQVTSDSGVDVGAPPVPYSKLLHNNFPFPRKLKFADGFNDVDQEKFSCYMTIVGTNSVNITAEHKTWYTDE